jgi:hypothetical protein
MLRAYDYVCLLVKVCSMGNFLLIENLHCGSGNLIQGILFTAISSVSRYFLHSRFQWVSLGLVLALYE